jgi:hypothetical protein
VLTPEEVSLIQDTWRFRGRGEREAVHRFTQLAGALEAADAQPDVIELARTAIEDETRHIGICDELIRHFGGEPVELPDNYCAVSAAPSGLDVRDAALYDVVGFCCIVESLNASLLVATLQIAGYEPVRNAVRDILRDEVNHSRIGWAHLQAERQAGRGEFLAAYLPQMLEDSGAKKVVVREDSLRNGESLRGYGEPSCDLRITVFSEALHEVIIPGFEAMEVETGPLRSYVETLLA